MPPKTLVFVYGTLKKGGSNARLMGDSLHLGTARLVPGTTLYTSGWYPMMVETTDADHDGVQGELYEVDERVLQSLDRFEGHPTHFQRREVSLAHVDLHSNPTCPAVVDALNKQKAEAYHYMYSVEGRIEIGDFFPV